MENCLFCKIVRGEIPCDKVFENDYVLAFNDIDKKAPEHVLLIPKVHIESIAQMEDDQMDYIAEIHKAIREVAKKLKLDEKGFRVVINTGEDGGQTVFHLHYHLLGGRGLSWPPG